MDTDPITLPCSLARAGKNMSEIKPPKNSKKNEVQCRDDVPTIRKVGMLGY